MKSLLTITFLSIAVILSAYAGSTLEQGKQVTSGEVTIAGQEDPGRGGGGG
ncbi:hypothetical protein [Thalassobacillus sp. CUG 92003]|uniref:hypothetical protein n=1 Tax=Thalassobacillus sp. CUG 92003 TaxID=2736641 RepID=UPI0015E6A423|nr:hypothetical protein [Thalassobacillus sp. CUG 92003]